MRILENPVVIVALIVLVIVLFGAKRLPDVARSVGSSLKIFKKEVKDLRDDDSDDRPAPGAQAPAPPPQQTPPAATPPVQPVTPPTGESSAQSGSQSTTS